MIGSKLTVDELSARAEMEAKRFQWHLEAFANRWGPTDSFARAEFYRDMASLMREAMSSQCATMSVGLETFACQMWQMRALHPIYAFEKDLNPKPKEPPP